MIPLRDNVPHINKPVVTVSLISINVLMFLYELTRGAFLPDFLMKFGFIPARIFADVSAGAKIVPLISSMFLHGGWLHLLGNSLYMWIFADNVEDKLGHSNFLMFYLFCGVFANLFHFIMNIHSVTPAIGASGAVAGVLGAYFLMFPGARVVSLIPFFIFFQIVEVPALFFLGIWFIFQLFYGMASVGVTSGIAFWAHIGGFFAGVFFVKYIWNRPQVEVINAKWREV